MLSWLNFVMGIPWWVWPLVGVPVMWGINRLFGLKGSLATALAIAVLIYGRRQRQQGWNDREMKGRSDVKKAIDQAREARANAERDNADLGGLYDDDGFRRD